MKVAWLAALAVAAASGCAGQQHWSDASLCRMERASSARAPDAETWIRLLLRGWDPETRRVTEPALDCTGAQVRWDAPALSCEDSLAAKTTLPPRALGPEDVVVSPVARDVLIVWIITTRYASGDALGPAAVVESESGSLVVRAIGPLRANPQQVRLRLERIGELKLAVAQGDQCASSDPASCQRSARLVPLRRDRFVPEAFLDEGGACLAPALIDIARQQVVKLDARAARDGEAPGGATQRRYTLDAGLLFAPTGLTIQEQIAAHDLDARQTAGPRLFRRAESERFVKLVNGRLVCTGTPLWARMVEPPASPAARATTPSPALRH